MLFAAELGPSVVAALAGLAGAITGGLVTWAVAKQQIDAQKDVQAANRQHEEKWRRRELYADFYGAASDSMTAWLAVVSSEEPDPFNERFTDQHTRFTRLQGMVRLYATTPVAAAADQMAACLEAVQMDVSKHLSKAHISPGPAVWMKHREDFAAARRQFVESVRVQNRAAEAAQR